MLELTSIQWTFAALAALVFGITKTGVPGIGMVGIVLIASVMDVKQSVGFVLPLLVMADIFAVAYYRRHAEWKHLIRLMPPALVGILIGYFWLDRITPGQLRPLLGLIVITLLGLDLWNNTRKQRITVPDHWGLAMAVGVVAGVTTMLANAAGPLIMLYFLAMRFDKHRFIGTSAWYFLVLNCIKVPFQINLGNITLASFLTNLALLPAVVVGALCGVFVLRRIPQRGFAVSVKILAGIAALKLLFS
jgi:uncharacterized protein